MPQIFKVGSFVIYFWSNENNPTEPIHVHVSEGKAVANSTKIWITNTGRALLCNNNSKGPPIPAKYCPSLSPSPANMDTHLTPGSTVP